MKFRHLALAALGLSFAAAGSVAAEDAGNFVVRLGQDTTSVETYTRTPARVEVHQVGRAPRVLERHFTYDYVDGMLSRFEMIASPVGSTTPTQTIHATIEPDSLRLKVQSGSAPEQNSAVVMPKGTLVVASSSPWTGYETTIMKFYKSKSDSLRTTMYFLGADATSWLSLHRIGRDSVEIFNEHQDIYHVKVDKDGHILGVLPIAGTGKFTVNRIAKLDVPAMAASFAAREKAGAGIGTLSPRDTVNVANAGGAALWFDYGRPGKRGRVVYGEVVPFGEVWRTGANAATQFKTDKALAFGSTVVPPGFYTLWTIPSANGWKLVVNGETGQWGTAHKAEKDLYTIDMNVTSLPQVVERFTISVEPSATGGVLDFDWDTTRASVAFTVQP